MWCVNRSCVYMVVGCSKCCSPPTLDGQWVVVVMLVVMWCKVISASQVSSPCRRFSCSARPSSGVVLRGRGGGRGRSRLAAESLSAAFCLRPPGLSGASWSSSSRLRLLGSGVAGVRRGSGLVARSRPGLRGGLVGGGSFPYSLADLCVAGLPRLLLCGRGGGRGGGGVGGRLSRRSQ